MEGAKGVAKRAEELAVETGSDPEDVFHVLNHLASNSSNIERSEGGSPSRETFRFR
jgi:hypothetical protein